MDERSDEQLQENRVLALLDRPDEVAAAIDELVSAGFGGDEIFVLCGPNRAERLDVSGGDHGLRGRTYRILERMGDGREVLLCSGEHLAARGLEVIVPGDEETKPMAVRILADHGGHEIAHFGKGHWEPLGP